MSKPRTLVMKFGGTSVGSPEALRNVAQIVQSARQEWDRVIVVSSAFSRVTDALLESTRQAARGNLAVFDQTLRMLQDRHFSALQELVQDEKIRAAARRETESLLAEFSHLVQAIAVLREASPRVLDAVVGQGERLAVRVIAAILQSQDIEAAAVDATRLIVTDGSYQAAVPQMDLTRQKTRQTLEPLLSAGQVPVVTGFLGATIEGTPTTLGRGGSDYSAAILGVVLPADAVWIWTDVDGVMTADPRLAPDARSIPALSYREVAELAYFGAKVLHPKTIRPVVEAGIPLRVLNTFNPRHPGTLIGSDQVEDGAIIKAVTAIRAVNLITVEGRGMLGVPGVAARIFSAVATTGTTVPLITEASSEQSLCFAVPAGYCQPVLDVLAENLAEEIERRNIDRIWASQEVVIVTAVCPQMRNKLGVAGKIFSALGESRVNVLAIAHGSSEVSISLVVSLPDLETTIHALHRLTHVPAANGVPLPGD